MGMCYAKRTRTWSSDLWSCFSYTFSIYFHCMSFGNDIVMRAAANIYAGDQRYNGDSIGFNVSHKMHRE